MTAALVATDVGFVGLAVFGAVVSALTEVAFVFAEVTEPVVFAAMELDSVVEADVVLAVAFDIVASVAD